METQIEKGDNKLKHVVLAFSHFDTGGLQTLIIRTAKWCKLNSIDCTLFYKTCDNNMFELCKNELIEVIPSFKSKDIIKKLTNILYEHDDLTIITFELPEFLYFESIRLKKFKRKNIRHLIYNVSVSGMIYGRNIKGKYGECFFNFYRKLMMKYLENNQVIFMDAETENAALEYYQIKNITPKIFLLPMFISERNKKSNIIEKENKIILTVSRASFPYKGYLIGLIDDFCQINDKFDNVKLVIVSFGEDMEILRNKINGCHANVKKNIILKSQMSSSQIREILRQSYVYIGMGTTILDAADEGIPSIVTWHSTMSNISSGLFCDNPLVVGRYGKGIAGLSILEDILSLKKEAYYKLCDKTYLEFKKYYDINNILPQMINRELNTYNVILTYKESLINKLFFSIRSIRRKIMNLDKLY